MNIYHKLSEWLNHGQSACLLLVVDSQGSAPGRKGFKMLISSNGELHGSIGGGLMEHNLVEKARALLKQGDFNPELVKQVHNRSSKHSSGMICSGSQQVAIYHFSQFEKALLDDILNNDVKLLTFNHEGCRIDEFDSGESLWFYQEELQSAPKVHLFGGGHVSVPTSRLLKDLGYEVHLYDNRKEINTFSNNQYVKSKQLIDYASLNDSVVISPSDLIILMTHKYLEDKLLVSQLLERHWAYCGVLGSQNKINTMFAELQDEGFSKGKLDRLNAPVGLPIKSETPEEISVSIAAELIQLRNNS